MVSPTVYRSLAEFNTCHVYNVDIFDKPSEYKNLELLTENLLLNSVLKTKEDVLPDLPECIISDIEYDLDAKHLALYKELANNKLLEWKDGDKLDATQATALYHALGR